MINANDYGFLPGNGADDNSAALQKAVDLGGEISVSLPGIYDLSETIRIGDNTTLIFEKGITVRRKACKNGINGQAFINKGCFDAVYNRNIKIKGLHIDCCGVESTGFGVESRFVGLRAQIGMIYVKNLVIEDFQCVGLLKKDYGIQISAFENVHLESLYIEGEKDGVHLAFGKGFVIKHGRFCTFDDPIALNAFDYSTSNTHVGWIEDGLIEDCYDLAAESTTGYFCRILGGAWCDWKKGMAVQHSDTVCHEGYVYRAVLKPDGSFTESSVPPSHRELNTTKEFGGISWSCVRNEPVYNTGCRNIVFRDIHLQKQRRRAIMISLNNDAWARSYVHGCTPVPQGNITLERIYVENSVETLLGSDYPCENITLKDVDLKDSNIHFSAKRLPGLTYPTVNVTLHGVPNAKEHIFHDEDHPINLVFDQ